MNAAHLPRFNVSQDRRGMSPSMGRPPPQGARRLRKYATKSDVRMFGTITSTA